jgi:hypothetical protein
MLTARQALRRAKKNMTRSPEMQARLADAEALIKQGVFELPLAHEKPEMIVGSPWPSPNPGVQRFECADCRGYIGLSPDSGAPVASKYPDVPVLCYACARRRALAV